MMRDRGAVLINALVVVLAISAVAVAMLTRSEAARVRALDARNADQLELYLDGIDVFVPQLLDEVVDQVITHTGQIWARRGVTYPIDRGQVAVNIHDMQGRLNINWLSRDDDYTRDLFARVFGELDVPQSLVFAIADFISPSGPQSGGYLARRPGIIPRGGPMSSIQELRAVDGMTDAYFDALQPYVTALPIDTRLNLNTADKIVKAAAIAPLPPELIAEILERDKPIDGMSELRQRAIEILETEDIEDLPFDRLTFASLWFQADLTAMLDGNQQRRVSTFRIEVGETPGVVRQWRRAVYD